MSGREVIRLEKVSKRYRLGTIGTRTLVEDVSRLAAKLRGKPDPLAKLGEVNRREEAGGDGYVWALRGIDLSLREGEVVAIIGRNGAGKSTLLKLLSRITLPTEGVIKARGRIASLLEIGTGFHLELSGRENVYLNGAILGMRKREVTARLEQIVEFAGVAKYIDTPVKRYSSGMLVRLAFAVAAHLDCEILVVDEVLAVGDAEFQKRCIGKMREVADQGARTVLFVSHNMGMVSSLCERGVVLEEGRLVFDGTQTEAVHNYELHTRSLAGRKVDSRLDRAGLGSVRITHAEVVGSDGAIPHCGGPARFRLRFRADREIAESAIFSVIVSHQGSPLMTLSTDFAANEWPEVWGEGTLEFEVPKLPLKRGEYALSVKVFGRAGLQDDLDGALYFEVGEGNFYGSGRHGFRFPNTPLVEHDWTLSLDDER